MTRDEKLEPPYHIHQNISTSKIPHYQLSPQVLVTPVVSTWGQAGEFPSHINEIDGKEMKCIYEYPSSIEPPVGKRTGNDGDKYFADRASIEQPSPLPGTPHPYLPRPSANLDSSPQESRGFTIPKSPQIDPRNLGSENEALHSHPCLEGLTWDSTQSDKETKAWNRKFVIYGRGDADHIILKGPEHSETLVTERPRSPIFSSKARDATLELFPSPESWETNGEKIVEEPADSAIPAIQLNPPAEGDTQKVDTGHLCVNRAYKDLHEKSERENRKLNGQLRRLLPLASLLSEAEGIDIEDTQALKEALRDIIEDNRRLTNLWPLAVTLSADQGIELNTDEFGALHHALEKALADVKRAKFAAGHHKRIRKSLECRVRRLENELSSLRYAGDEDYIR
ncbi:hypothetical protein F4823DRAFT_639579 [Ustulina deusta]|nr:hypothetical protein F4823DRAFT_639579 [Ustulina deusta]